MLGMAALLTPSTLAEALPAVNADYIISLETSLPLLGDLMELLVKKKIKKKTAANLSIHSNQASGVFHCWDLIILWTF